MTKLSDTFPWIAATLLGAAAPALISGILSGPYFFTTAFVLTFAVTLAHAALLGLPVALFYRAQKWTGLGRAIVGGFLIGALPYGVFFMPRAEPKPMAPVDQMPNIVEGIPTSSDWQQYFELLGLLGCYGALGAMVFWLTLWWLGALKVADEGAELPQ